VPRKFFLHSLEIGRLNESIEESHQMHDFWTLLLGAFLATSGGFWQFQHARNQERKSLKAALAAEFARFYQLWSGVIT
jgi:hypothetical protein